ncbi:MAG: hypothetical protein L7S72_11310 [Flavobacteriales bacterium]|nr:hypothetical protein [Flavobacteriales bacterium]
MAKFTDTNVQIERYLGRNGNYLTNRTLTGQNTRISEVLVYDSVKSLYYSNYISGSGGEISVVNTASFLPDGVITGSDYTPNYFNYEQTDLNPQKTFPTASQDKPIVPVAVYSIPSKLYGDKIKPGSVVIESEISGSILDDGEGRLYTMLTGQKQYVGNVIYPHGIIAITNDDVQIISQDDLYGTAIYGDAEYGGSLESTTNFVETYAIGSTITASFSSSYTLYETQYKVTIGADEYNYSQNPSIATGSDGSMLGFATSSYFAPYVTTVGLYNDNFELLAVGKLAKPLPTSRTTDTTILINFDTQ